MCSGIRVCLRVCQRRVIAKLRRSFASGKTRPLQWRLEQLEALRRCLRESEDIFIEALHRDLHKVLLVSTPIRSVH